MAVPGGRERYYQALYARLKAKVSVRVYTRLQTEFDRLGIDQQPALLLSVSNQLPSQRPRLPPQYLLGAVVELKAWDTKGGVSADTTLNNLCDQVEDALAWQEGEPVPGNGELLHTTLGGLVQRCWISDDIAFETGSTSDQVTALIPVVMELTGSRTK